MSELDINKNKLHKHISNSNYPKIGPCGTQNRPLPTNCKFCLIESLCFVRQYRYIKVLKATIQLHTHVASQLNDYKEDNRKL